MTEMVRWEPFPANVLANFHPIFTQFWSEPPTDVSRAWSPRFDVQDRGDQLTLQAELPGMRREDIHVSLDNGVMTVYGERKPMEEGTVLRSERVYGRFVRSFTLPDTVDPSRIEASYEDGVLNVRLPKTASARPRQIEIRAA